MLVRSTRLGYYGNIRIREGQLFRLNDKSHFSQEWMIKADKKSKGREVSIAKLEPIESPLVSESEAEQVITDQNSDVI